MRFSPNYGSIMDPLLLVFQRAAITLCFFYRTFCSIMSVQRSCMTKVLRAKRSLFPVLKRRAGVCYVCFSRVEVISPFSRSLLGAEVEGAWRRHVMQIMDDSCCQHAVHSFYLFSRLYKEVRRSCANLTREACQYLTTEV